MKIFMTGGSGFVGTILLRELARQGHEITVLTRSIREDRPLPKGASFLQGDPTQSGAWQERVPEHEIIINLAGASISKRWSERVKREIRDSRVLTTRKLVEALSRGAGKESLLMNTSAIGYYGFHGDEDLNEKTPPGDDFLARVCREWEASALEAERLGLRVLLCRFGIVLGAEGGVLSEMLPLFKKGLGSPLGSGKQWISWIHQEDLAKIYLFLIHRTDISGPVNCTAPNPVRNREMSKILGEVLHRPTVLPSVPGFILRLRVGEFASALLEGQKVLPEKLLEAGYDFRFSRMEEALKDLLV